MGTEDRLAILEHRMGAMESAFKEHLDASRESHQALLHELQSNTRLTQRVFNETSEVRAIWTQGAAALKFFNFLMRWAKRVAVVGFLIAVLFFGIPYMMTHNGELPAWLKSLKAIVL